MRFRPLLALLIAPLVVACSSSSGTGFGSTPDSGHPVDATKKKDSATKDVATSTPDSSGGPADAGVDAPVAKDAGTTASPEAGCPVAIPTETTPCPLPGTGCLYLSDAGETQCACGADGNLDCAVCPANPVIGAACTGGPELTCVSTSGWCGCNNGVWACVPAQGNGAVDAGCPIAPPVSGESCAPLQGTDCAFVPETCVCSPGGLWNCNPCQGPLSATGTVCAGGLPVESCGFTEQPAGWFCKCVNGTAACEQGGG